MGQRANARADAGEHLPAVTWNRDGRTVAADNRGGSFTSQTFNTPGIQSARPRIAISSGSVTVGVIVSIGSRLYATSEA